MKRLAIRRAARLALLLPPLALAGCFHAHVIDEQDAAFCEAQGLPRATDANADCAMKREADRIESGAAPPAEDHPAAAAPLLALPPPVHPGGVAQETPATMAPGATTTINFFVSVTPDCSVDGMPSVRIVKQPEHGAVKVIQREDFARASQNALPVACGKKRLAGLAVEYTAKRDYSGDDALEFETITKTGGKTEFKVPITVEPPDEDD